MAQTNSIAVNGGQLGRGLGTPLLLLLLLAMMVVPLPPLLLDALFSFNIALALVVLLAVVYTSRPLEFAAFPTVLLLATLLRLALNVASTRVVLLQGHTGPEAAGQVIHAFGDFVIGGNYAVGIVVFAVLVIINFVVVTKGAGRISEVSARFILDAMPGKQMAIDADLNAGSIDQHEARRRRQEVAQEADFYGSMDGASKFVRVATPSPASWSCSSTSWAGWPSACCSTACASATPCTATRCSPSATAWWRRFPRWCCRRPRRSW